MGWLRDERRLGWHSCMTRHKPNFLVGGDTPWDNYATCILQPYGNSNN